MQNNNILERVRQQHLEEKRKRYADMQVPKPIDITMKNNDPHFDDIRRRAEAEGFFVKTSALTSSCTQSIKELSQELSTFKIDTNNKITELCAKIYNREGDTVWNDIQTMKRDLADQIERMDEVIELLCDRMEELEIGQEEVMRQMTQNSHRFVTHSELASILEAYSKKSLDSLTTELSSLHPDILSERMRSELSSSLKREDYQ